MIQVQRMINPDDEHQRAYFSRTELTRENASAERGAGPVDDPFLSAVIEIPGVVMAFVQPYALTVGKAPTYEWSEIEPSLLMLMTTFNVGEGKLESAQEVTR